MGREGRKGREGKKRREGVVGGGMKEGRKRERERR